MLTLFKGRHFKLVNQSSHHRSNAVGSSLIHTIIRVRANAYFGFHIEIEGRAQFQFDLRTGVNSRNCFKFTFTNPAVTPTKGTTSIT